jgi:hypothetical protein
MESKPRFKPDSGLKLMDQVRQVMRYHHYAYRIEQTYCDWIVAVEGFLSHLRAGYFSASC